MDQTFDTVRLDPDVDVEYGGQQLPGNPDIDYFAEINEPVEAEFDLEAELANIMEDDLESIGHSEDVEVQRDDDLVFPDPPPASTVRLPETRPPIDADPLELRRALALSHPSTAVVDMCPFFEMTSDLRWRVWCSRTGTRIGVIRQIEGRCLQAACDKHQNCKLILKFQPFFIYRGRFAQVVVGRIVNAVPGTPLRTQ